jgi:hypothetical protein
MPQALLGSGRYPACYPRAKRPDAMPKKHSDLLTVQDENLKNLMMSWYYAGYYTGLHAGQQQAASNDAQHGKK